MRSLNANNAEVNATRSQAVRANHDTYHSLSGALRQSLPPPTGKWAPNPARRHTRGRRGKGIAIFGVPEGALEKVWEHARDKSRDLAKAERVRLKNRRFFGAKGKLRLERTYHKHALVERSGGGFYEGDVGRRLRMDEDTVFWMHKAHQAQVARGLLTSKKRMRVFSKYLGHTTGRAEKKAPKVHSAYTAKWLQGVVASFRKSGAMPAEGADIVSACAHEGVHEKWRKRLISTLLARANKDVLNPGPCPCMFAGKDVNPRVERLNHGRHAGKFLCVCPNNSCGASLCALDEAPPIGFTVTHPREWEESGFVQEEFRNLAQAGKEALSSLSRRSEKEPELPDPPIPSGSKDPSAVTAAVGPTGVERHVHGLTIRVTKRTGEPIPDPPTVVALPKPRAALDGMTLTDEQARQVVVSQFAAIPESVVTRKLVVDYTEDNRLIADRTVQITKQPLVVQEIAFRGVDCSVPVVSGLLRALLWMLVVKVDVSWLLFLPGLLSTGLMVLQAWMVLGTVTFWLFWVFVVPVIIVILFAFAGMTWLSRPLLTAGFDKVREQLIKMTACMWSDMHLFYSPHVVSSVVCEFSRNLTEATLDGLVTQRMNRLGSLPIPDKTSAAIKAGSRIVCIYVLHTQPFFGCGAVPLGLVAE